GSRVQTRGPWETRGAQIVFTLPNGTLAAVRADSVDLDGSARITAEAKAPKPQPTTPPATSKPVRTITDADVTHYQAPPAAPGAAADKAKGAATPAAAATATVPASDLQVITWSSRYDINAHRTTLQGTIRNSGKALVFNVKIVVSAFSADGTLLFKSEAAGLATGVSPGGTASF